MARNTRSRFGLLCVLGGLASGALADDQEKTLRATRESGDSKGAAIMVEIALVQFDRPDESEQRIPLLSELPVLGPLFRSSGGQEKDARAAAMIAATISASKIIIEHDPYVLKLEGGTLVSLVTGSKDAAGGKPPWKLISAPRLIVKSGQKASISVGQQVAYMTQREDGSLVVERSQDAFEGLSIELRASISDERSISIDNLNIKVSRVVGRQPIPDVPFDVGRPIIRTTATSASLNVSPDQVAVFRLPQAGDEQDIEPIVIILSAKTIEK